MRGKSSSLIFIITVCMVVSGRRTAHSDPSIPIEYQVKAAFLYKFIRFIEWPSVVLPDTSSPVTIGVLGESDIHAALESIVGGKEVKGHKLAISHFKKPEDLGFCHVLFISRSGETHLEEVLEELKGSSTLTVSEIEGFAQLGGMINFVIVENRVRFEINAGAAEEADLKISSKLLRLARIVKEKK